MKLFQFAGRKVIEMNRKSQRKCSNGMSEEEKLKDPLLRLLVLATIGRQGDAFTEAAQLGRYEDVKKWIAEGIDINVEHSVLNFPLSEIT